MLKFGAPIKRSLIGVVSGPVQPVHVAGVGQRGSRGVVAVGAGDREGRLGLDLDDVVCTQGHGDARDREEEDATVAGLAVKRRPRLADGERVLAVGEDVGNVGEG